jgi:hypothetical protein
MTRLDGPAPETDGAVVEGVAAERSHVLLLRVLALALIGRALLSLADALSIGSGGIGILEPGGIAHADGSALWPLLWGGVALLAAVLLLFGRPLGWVLGAGVCVAYLVVGVGHAVGASSSTSGLSAGVWLIFVVDILVPSLVLASLFTVRPWFLAAARAGRAGPRGRAPTP